MTAVQLVLFTAEEARSLTNEVKADAAALWTKLLQLYEGRAHEALGYSSWAAYCAAEFDMQKSAAYRLLDAGRVVATLGADSPIGDSPLNEAQARELAPLLDRPEHMRQAWTNAVEQSNGKPTAFAVREIVRGKASTEKKPGRSTGRHQPGWFELLGDVEIALEQAELRLGKLEKAVTRKPNKNFITRADEAANRVERIGVRLSKLGPDWGK